MNQFINNLCEMMKDDPALACAIMDVLFKDDEKEKGDE